MSTKCPFFLLDIAPQHLSFHLDMLPEKQYFLLTPTRMSIRKASKYPHARLMGEPLDGLRLLSHLQSEFHPISESGVLIGHQKDPFEAGIMGFSSILNVLKEVLEAHPLRVCLQTRSSLVMLLAPLLKAHKIEVCLSFDCIEDDLAQVLFPGRTRPSERLATLAALQKAGIRPNIQLFPILSRNASPRRITQFMRALGLGEESLFCHAWEIRGEIASGCKDAQQTQKLFFAELQDSGIKFQTTNVKDAKREIAEAA